MRFLKPSKHLSYSFITVRKDILTFTSVTLYSMQAPPGLVFALLFLFFFPSDGKKCVKPDDIWRVLNCDEQWRELSALSIPEQCGTRGEWGTYFVHCEILAGPYWISFEFRFLWHTYASDFEAVCKVALVRLPLYTVQVSHDSLKLFSAFKTFLHQNKL